MEYPAAIATAPKLLHYRILHDVYDISSEHSTQIHGDKRDGYHYSHPYFKS